MTTSSSSPALEDYFVHLMNSFPSPKADALSTKNDGELSMDQQTTAASISNSNSSCEQHDSVDGHDNDDVDDSSSHHDLTIVMDNAHLPAHCFEFSAGYLADNVDNPMEAFSQSLSAVNSVPFPPPFLEDAKSSSKWNFDESYSSVNGTGRDVPLNIPSRSRDADDVLVFSDDENDDEGDTNSLTIHPPGHTSSLDSTTKWLRELPLEHSPLGRSSNSPSSRSRQELLVRGGSGVGRYCRDTPLRCPPSPALCIGDDDDELPSLRECPYDEEVEVHPRRSSLSGIVDVTAITAALELLEYDDDNEEEEDENDHLRGSDSSVATAEDGEDDDDEDEDSLVNESASGGDAVDESQRQQENRSTDGNEDGNNHINESSFRSVEGPEEGNGMHEVKLAMISPPTCQLLGCLLDRRARLSSHISPTGIVDFPQTSPICVDSLEKGQAHTGGNSGSKGNTTVNKSPKSSSGSSRHQQLVKKLAVVFETTDEMDRLVLSDRIST